MQTTILRNAYRKCFSTSKNFFTNPACNSFVGTSWKQGQEYNRGKLVSGEIDRKICESQTKSME